MLAAHNAKERSVREFEAIFKEASPHLQLIGVTGGGEGAFQSIVEFAYVLPQNGIAS